MANDYLEKANHLFEEAMSDTKEKLNVFEKTFYYRQLNYSERRMSRRVIMSFSEYMFDYHFQTLDNWNEQALQDVLLDIFPHEVIAGKKCFEKILLILVKFFEFLYFHEKCSQGLQLAKTTKNLKELVLLEVENLLIGTPEADLLTLGEEIGLDIGNLEDIDCLYQLAELIQNEGERSRNIVPMKVRKI